MLKTCRSIALFLQQWFRIPDTAISPHDTNLHQCVHGTAGFWHLYSTPSMQWCCQKTQSLVFAHQTSQQHRCVSGCRRYTGQCAHPTVWLTGHQSLKDKYRVLKSHVQHLTLNVQVVILIIITSNLQLSIIGMHVMQVQQLQVKILTFE